MSVTVHHGDSREVLKGFADGSIDACVCDPPYALVSIGKRFGADGAAPAKSGKSGVYARASAGFMGQKWDTGETAFDPEFWREVYRVLKPGAHVVAFSGTRTYHRLACAIEDAGFEIRDMVAWLYGSGFPKSHDVSKGIDKARKDDCLHVTAFLRAHASKLGIGTVAVARALGFAATEGTHGVAAFLSGDPRLARVPTLDQWRLLRGMMGFGSELDAEVDRLNRRKGTAGDAYMERPASEYDSAPGMRETWTDGRGWNGKAARGGSGVTAAARQWDGWGTALKPALEPIVFARKPLIGTVAANVLEHGTGALNIDGCRVDGNPKAWGSNTESEGYRLHKREYVAPPSETGRWPANVVLDGSAEVVDAFPIAPGQQRALTGDERSHRTKNAYGDFGATRDGFEPRNDSGSAASFFYQAKADQEDRLGSRHPTVKPIDLMAWLCRLVTPPGGVILDPFAGTGTTGLAAMREGFSAILIEREAQYVADIERRLAWARGEGRMTAQEMARDEPKTVDDLPLFGGGSSMKVLDLFCGEGGAGYGYSQAGYEVVGADYLPQRRYPFAFLQTDFRALDVRFIRYFDLVHASPPCQFGTELNSDKSRHVNWIPAVRTLLQRAGVRYVIENVRAVRDHLEDPVSLFGQMFGNHMVTSTGQRFDLSRERLFETNWPLRAPRHGLAAYPIANVFGGHLRARSGEYRTGKGTGRTRDFIGEDKPALARQLMGMPWASMVGMSEAVPPAYTRWVGQQFAALAADRVAA